MEIRDFLSRLEGVKQTASDQWVAKCPAHGDSTPSLTVGLRDGKILCKCFVGCSFGDIINALHIDPKEMFPPKEEKKEAPVQAEQIPRREHIYTDDMGIPLFKKVVSGYVGKKKQISWFRLEGDTWKEGLNGGKAPLYNLPALEDADVIYWPEGEKDADTLVKLGYTATSNPNGAGEAYRPEWDEVFRGKTVIILTDNDEPGAKRGERMAEAVKNVAKFVKIIPAAAIYGNVKEKGDISDIAQEVGLEQTKMLLDNAMERKPSDENIEQITVTEIEEPAPVIRNPNNGRVMNSIDNFLCVMLHDKPYQRIRYNVVLNSAEVHENGTVRKWTDADDAESRRYIESMYGLDSENKHSAALRLLFKAKEYNPIQDLISGLTWDGVNRCEHFLAKWAKCEDTPYTREVSRLIFADGIWRLYSPGCKADDVVVLVGKQGCGKSTLVRWLACNDKFFGEISTVEGTQAVEQLEGLWIVEMAELLALTKSREQEAIKAFITRQTDKYRKPYDRNSTDIPRRCILIGTTNLESGFLKDRTGNRRFYPIKVNCNGYEVNDHEWEIRDYIAQCWAEAKARYDKGAMPNFADRALWSEYQKAQDEAMEDDWRVGAIEKYLMSKLPGSVVCVRELSNRALSPDSFNLKDPTPKDSQEISQIMDKYFAGTWERCGVRRTEEYGRQRCWTLTKGMQYGN